MSNPATPTPPSTVRRRIKPHEVPEAFFKKICVDPKSSPDGGVVGRLRRPPHIFVRYNPFDRNGAKISFFLNDPNVAGAELILEAQATPRGTLLISHELCRDSDSMIELIMHKAVCEDMLGDFIRDYVEKSRNQA